MSGDDYSDLAALWSAPPRKEEQRELEQLARQTVRRARLVQWGELAAAGAIIVAIASAVILNLSTTTVVVGSLVLLLVGWSAWKRHKLSDQAMLAEHGDRVAFLSNSIRAKEAELRRSALGLAFIVPGTLLMILLYFSIHHGGGSDLFAFLQRSLSSRNGIVASAAVAAAVIFLARGHRRLQSELGQLRALRKDYAEEARQDELESGKG